MIDPLLPRHLQVLAALVLLGFVGMVASLIRRRRLSLRDSLFWLLSTGCALAATVYPPILRILADALGIVVASNAVFAIAIVYLLLNLMGITLAISDSSMRLRRLTQECTLLRAELEQLRGRPRQGLAALKPEASADSRGASEP